MSRQDDRGTVPGATPATSASTTSATAAPGPVELTLFVSGAAPRSTNAVTVVRAVCDGDLAGGVRLQVQDALADPRAARAQDVVVLPTLVATRPGPRRHLVMDRTDVDQVRAWITDLAPAPALQDTTAPEVQR